MSLRMLSCAAAAAVGLGVPCASAQVHALEAPFVGEYYEGMESYPFVFGQPSFDIFFTNPPVPIDPHGVAVAVDGVMSGFTSSSIGGSTTTARTGVVFGHVSAGVVDFVFPDSLETFGGYFTSNGGGTGGTAQFFNGDDQLVATLPLNIIYQAPQALWVFNGWEFASPVTRVRLAANPGEFVGFLQFDDLHVTFVPGAGTMLALGAIPLTWCTRRQRTL